ncbi:hypothetical protein F5Y08DRAFT_327459 [Xylaria arbuscula]|nr:hypothetical protein F5Y08DRAFT_327459 [Xylaria arbuscula]
MDHLVHFQPFSRHPCRYPLVHKTWMKYDNGRFLQFHNRIYQKDVDVTVIAPNLNEYADFLQAWLFFGLLYEFSYIFHVPMFLSEFITIDEHGHRVVTTKKLRQYIWYWLASHTHTQQEELRAARGDACSAVLQVCREVILALRVHAEPGDHTVFGPRRYADSTRVSLYFLLKDQGWCSGEIMAFTSRGLSLSSFYLLPSRRRRPDWRGHSKCSMTVCNAYHVDDRTYQTLHAESGCKCKHHIQDGRYVAISHVRSDGMGNTRGNTLPCCLLRDLQFRVNRLYPEASGPIPFWIDTLCVPRIEQQKKAIRGLVQVYSCAEKVLVIDKTLQSIWWENASPYEAYLFNGICPWTTRLWTFQEAWLAKSVWFDFAHSPVEWFDLSDRWQDGEGPLKLHPSDLTSKHDGHSICIAHLRKALNLHNGISRPAVCQQDQKAHKKLAVHPTAQDHQLVDWLGRCDRLDPVWWDATEAYLRLRTSKQHPSLCDILQALAGRKTSRQDDESICLANILNIGVLPLLEQSSAERMKLFLRTVKNVPLAFLFVPVHRLPDVGFRWAPSSFLHAAWRHVYDMPLGRLENDGLHVALPGLRRPSKTALPDSYKIYIRAGSNFLRMIISGGLDEDGVVSSPNWSLYGSVSVPMVILEKFPMILSDSAPGALVALEREVNSRLIVSYCCPLRVELMHCTPSPDTDIVIEANFLAPTTEWCVS